jgi:hypothetical protein
LPNGAAIKQSLNTQKHTCPTAVTLDQAAVHILLNLTMQWNNSTHLLCFGLCSVHDVQTAITSQAAVHTLAVVSQCSLKHHTPPCCAG